MHLPAYETEARSGSLPGFAELPLLHRIGVDDQGLREHGGDDVDMLRHGHGPADGVIAFRAAARPVAALVTSRS